MLKYENGNLITGDYEIFCHQVNCKGRMGSGIAKQIKERYPEVFTDYKHHCDNGLRSLGDVLFSMTGDGRICINMFAQDGYGTDRQYTDYAAFQNCLNKIQKYLNETNRNEIIAFPYRIGCGLAGGDWTVISGMLEAFSENVKQTVVVVQLKT